MSQLHHHDSPFNPQQSTSSTISFPGLMSEIDKLSSIRIVQTRNPRPLLVAISLFAVLLALFVSAAAPDVEKALFWYQSRYLWVVVR